MQRYPERLTRAEQQARTRERVIAAAREVFEQQGYHGSSLEEIAARAGYTRGAVYANFKNKDDLLLEIVDRRYRDHLEKLKLALAANGSPGSQAAAFGEIFSRYLRAERAWSQLFQEFRMHAARDPELRRRLKEIQRPLIDTVGKLLVQQGAAFGIELPMPPSRLALALFAVSNGVAIEKLLDPRRADDQLLGEVLGLLVAGVLDRASGESSLTPVKGDAG